MENFRRLGMIGGARHHDGCQHTTRPFAGTLSTTKLFNKAKTIDSIESQAKTRINNQGI
jgi:hypothetical protein